MLWNNFFKKCWFYYVSKTTQNFTSSFLDTILDTPKEKIKKINFRVPKLVVFAKVRISQKRKIIRLQFLDMF